MTTLRQDVTVKMTSTVGMTAIEIVDPAESLWRETGGIVVAEFYILSKLSCV